jgi:multiple sugar transport system permease protein
MVAASLAPSGQPAARAGHLLPRYEGAAPGSGAYWSALGGAAAENYGEVWSGRSADFPLAMRNTLIVTILTVIGTAASSSVVAFGFSRLRWRGRDALFLLVLATMMIPFPVVMAPQYVLFKHLGWIGSFKPLWVPAWFGSAFGIFLLRQFFLAIPRELDEAAMLDGCSSWGVFRRIALPLAKPAIAVVALLQCVACWNDFVGPLVFLNHERMYTLSLTLFMYESQHGGTPWNIVMAASVLVIAPVVAVFLLAQRAFTEGIATQGLKG